MLRKEVVWGATQMSCQARGASSELVKRWEELHVELHLVNNIKQNRLTTLVSFFLFNASRMEPTKEVSYRFTFFPP